MKRPGFIIVWPNNIDSTKPRGAGRKLPMSRAVRQPSVREIMEAAKVLGLSPEETQKQAIPKSYWEKTGYVTVRKNASKVATLKAIAGEVVKARQKAPQAVEVRKTR